MSRDSIDFAYACGQGCSQLLHGEKSKFSSHDRPTTDSICYILIRDKYGSNPEQGFVVYLTWDEIAPLVMADSESSSESSAPLAIWTSWQTQKEAKSFIKGFKYLQFQFSSTRSGHPGFPVFAALRSEVVAKDDAKVGARLQDNAASRSETDDVVAIESLLQTDLSARYLMGSTFPDHHSLCWLSLWQRSQLLLLLNFSLKAYALGKGMTEADSRRVWDLLEKKYNSSDTDAPSEVRLQRARWNQDAPSPEMSETERRLLEIIADIAAIPLDPMWTTPPRGSQLRRVTLPP